MMTPAKDLDRSHDVPRSQPGTAESGQSPDLLQGLPIILVTPHECFLHVFSDLVTSNFPLLRNPQALSTHSPHHPSCLLQHWHAFHESSSLEQPVSLRYCMETPVLYLIWHCTLVTKSPGGQLLSPKALAPQPSIRIKDPRCPFSTELSLCSNCSVPA